MSKAKRAVYIILDLVIMAVLVSADRYTKMLAAEKLKDSDPYKLISGVFELRYLENRGAAFGLLQDQRTLFIIVGSVFLVIILYFLIRLPATKKYRLLRLCLVMLGAGAIGNLYDRITMNYVIDFLYFIYIDFPIFNVADIYVTVSAALLVILFLFIYKEEDLDMKKANTVKLHSSMMPVQNPEPAPDAESTAGAEAEKKEDTDNGSIEEAEKDAEEDTGAEAEKEKAADSGTEAVTEKDTDSDTEEEAEPETGEAEPGTDEAEPEAEEGAADEAESEETGEESSDE